MMNRKWYIFMLVLTGALLLGGCETNQETEKKEVVDSESITNTGEESKSSEYSNVNSNEDSNEDSDKSVQGTDIAEENEPVQGMDSSEENKPVQDINGAVEEQTAANIPAIVISSVRKEWYAEDEVTLLLEAEDNQIKVENEGFEALNHALAERFYGIKEEEYEELLASAKDHYETTLMEENGYFSAYYSNKNVELVRCDSSVLSFRVYYGDYTGGAHGFYGYGGATFDVKSGEELSISDILTDESGFYETAPDYIADVLYDEYGDELFGDYREYVEGTFSEERSLSWYLSATGIVIVYNPYELGPYSMGYAEVVLPFEEFAEYIDTKFTGTQNEMVASVSPNENMDIILGENSRVCIKTQWNEYDMLSVSIVSGEKEEVIGEFGRFCEAYVLKRNHGRSFLIVTCDGMSDDFVTFIYEVTDGNITKCGELGGAEISGGYITTDKIEMRMRLDVLGTYFARVNYILDEDGNLTQEEDNFTIDSVSTLTITRPLPVVLEGEEVLLNTDTQIRLTGTNNVDAVYFEVPETKATGIIYYENDEESPWIHMIDGVPEDEYFEMLPYAG